LYSVGLGETALHKVRRVELEADGEARTHGGADGRDRLQKKASALFKRAAPAVSPSVGAGAQELI
jgi:hypothetical protein